MSGLLEKPVLNRKGQKEHELIIPLAEQLWGIHLRPKSKEASLLMDYYNAKTTTIDLSVFGPTCHSDIVHLVTLLKKGKDKTLKELQKELLDTDPKPCWLLKKSENAAAKVLQCAASIWLMIATTDWRDTESLSSFAQNLRSHDVLDCKVTELRVSAKSLNQIAGIDLIWTSDLREHLYYDEAQCTLSLFRHASFLEDRLESGYSAEFLRETASTIALLFPYVESSDRRWNRRVRKKADLDVEVGLSTTLSRDPHHYKYWAQQLVRLEIAFHQSKPTSIRQWYHDTRDGSQFYAFWLAVAAITLTLLFGLIQSITGILQVLKK